jgi:2-C-methyl-D-erythritol 2,4-cyclodiphosphate synthase
MIRIGQGLDVHRFVKNRPCIIGGVTIDHPLGLEGHSDADVLLHAIADAILGAISEGDIGHHFSDQDSKNKDLDSRIILKNVFLMAQKKGFNLVNLDVTIICEKPKISPHVQKMKKNIAEDCSCELSQINIKATTTEGLGFLGRGEGIAAQAICLMEKD